MLVTKNMNLAEKVTLLGASLLSIKRAEKPLEPRTYTFKEEIDQFLAKLEEVYGMRADDVLKLVERTPAGKAPEKKKGGRKNA